VEACVGKVSWGVKTTFTAKGAKDAKERNNKEAYCEAALPIALELAEKVLAQSSQRMKMV
jgi:hypothetical protein